MSNIQKVPGMVKYYKSFLYILTNKKNTGREKDMKNKGEKIEEIIAMVERMTEEQFRWFTYQVQHELFCKDDQLSRREDSK